MKLVQVWGSVTADLIRNEKVLIQSYLLLTSGSSFMPVCSMWRTEFMILEFLLCDFKRIQRLISDQHILEHCTHFQTRASSVCRWGA